MDIEGGDTKQVVIFSWLSVLAVNLGLRVKRWEETK